jgi:hypothetical protein
LEAAEKGRAIDMLELLDKGANIEFKDKVRDNLYQFVPFSSPVALV